MDLMAASSRPKRVPKPPYPKAPIIEAVIDIHVEREGVDPDVVVKSIDDFAKDLHGFPSRQPHTEVVFQIKTGPDGRPSFPHEEKQAGWRLHNELKSRQIQVRNRGLAYIHLAPYTEWDVFSKEARSVWDRYVSLCVPRKVTRLAVRNINRLKLPTGDVQLASYLRIAPQVPANFGLVSEVLMKVVVPQKDSDKSGTTIVTLATEPTQATDYQPLILDIDAFRVGGWNPGGDDIWNELERLRRVKNDLFEGCITDEMRRHFA